MVQKENECNEPKRSQWHLCTVNAHVRATRVPTHCVSALLSPPRQCACSVRDAEL